MNTLSKGRFAVISIIFTVIAIVLAGQSATVFGHETKQQLRHHSNHSINAAQWNKHKVVAFKALRHVTSKASRNGVSDYWFNRLVNRFRTEVLYTHRHASRNACVRNQMRSWRGANTKLINQFTYAQRGSSRYNGTVVYRSAKQLRSLRFRPC